MRLSLFLIPICLTACAAQSADPGSPSTDPGPNQNQTTTAASNCATNNLWAQVPNPWLLTTPKVHIIFWGSWWTETGQYQFNQMDEAWNILGNDPNFYRPLAQYGIGVGSMPGTYSSNWNIPTGNLSEDYIQQELATEIANDTLPANDSNTTYVIELPAYSNSLRDVNTANGHHGVFNNIVYAVIDYSSDYNKMNWVTSHEIYESATNPDTVSGYWSGSGDTEVGDYCNGQTYTLDNYTIQQVWSQTQCECAP